VSGMSGVYERHGLDPQEEDLRSGRRPGEPGWGEEDELQWGRLSAEVDGVAVDRAVQPEPGAYQDFYAVCAMPSGVVARHPWAPPTAWRC